MGDKIRTCYIIDRTLHSKRTSETDLRKLAEHYHSKVRMLLNWVVESAADPFENVCVNLLLRLLISLPPKDAGTRRDFADTLSSHMPRQEGTTSDLLRELVASFQ